MTLTKGKYVAHLLRNGGKDPDEPSQVQLPFIYSFKLNGSTHTHYAAFTDGKYDDMDESPFVSSYKCLMANGILTVEGQEFLQSPEAK